MRGGVCSRTPIASGRKKASFITMLLRNSKSIVLIAEDDENDAFLLKRSIQKSGLNMPVHVCLDGDEAMQYLRGDGQFSARDKFPFPRMLVTDLKMPKCSGFDILQWLQSHPECNLIPKVVLSSSNQEADIIRAYQLGANCYFQKTSDPNDLGKIVQTLHGFWSLAELPPLPEKC
jgi:CheY-like chemotaxis protein